MRRDTLAKIKIDTKLFREVAIEITIARRTSLCMCSLGQLHYFHKRALAPNAIANIIFLCSFLSRLKLKLTPVARLYNMRDSSRYETVSRGKKSYYCRRDCGTMIATPRLHRLAFEGKKIDLSGERVTQVGLLFGALEVIPSTLLS